MAGDGQNSHASVASTSEVSPAESVEAGPTGPADPTHNELDYGVYASQRSHRVGACFASAVPNVSGPSERKGDGSRRSKVALVDETPAVAKNPLWSPGGQPQEEP